MRWKWVFIIVGGLIFIPVVSLYLILSVYDLNHLEPEIARVVKDATGRDLTIGGEIGLKIGFAPALSMENLSLENTPWGSRPEMVRIKRFEIEVALLPLVFKEIEIRRFVLVEPDILFETDHSGASNLMFMKPNVVSTAQRKGDHPVLETGLQGFTIGEIEIEKGIIGYRDGQSGKTYMVALEKLTAAASGHDRPVRLKGTGSANGEAFQFSGDVGPLSALTEPGKHWPVKLAAKAAGVSVSLDGEIQDAMHAGDYTLNVEARGPSSADLARLMGDKSLPELGPFKVLAKSVGEKEKLSIDSFDIDLGLEQLIAWKFTGRIQDPLAQRGAEIDFKIYGKDLDMVGRLAAKPMPIPGPFQVSGHAGDVADKVYQISDLKVSVGENDLAGSLRVDFGSGRPGIKGSLASHKLDLRPFLAKDKSENTPAGLHSGTAKSGRVFPSDPLSVDIPKKVDVNLQVQARQVFTPRLTIDNLLVGVVLDNGALTFNPLKAGMGGGTVDGHLALRAKGKAVGAEVVLKVNRLDVDLVAKELEFAEKPGGKLDLDLDLKGEGGSLAEIMAGLNGMTMLTMGNGRISNKYLDLLGADVSSSTLRLLNPFGHETPYVEINCLVSRFDIREGIARSTALVLDAHHVTVVGEGQINLKTEELDLSFKPSPKEGIGISGLDKVSLGLGELARPFKLGGTLARPAMVFDVTQAALSVGKAVGETALFGPAGIAAFLASGSPTKGNACLAALDASKKGVKPSGDKLEEIEGAARRVFEGAGEKLKKMFGR